MKMREELAKKTIAELSNLIKSGEISPVEVTKSVIERTDKYDKLINSYISRNDQQALEVAKQAEKEIHEGVYKGSLHGIPLALKDIFYFENENVTMGSKIHKDFVPEYDATVVKKLKNSGAVFTGKLNMHEYAYGGTTNNEHFGACHNPWNLDRIPGGSSGGSGAAIAADLTIATLGTDTAGSIRIPAAACGTVGLKPTHGLVSKYGVFPLSWSLDHVGPLTKTVEDAAIMLENIVGYDENDATSVKAPMVKYTEYLTGNIRGKIIAIEEDFFFHNIDSGVESLVRKSIKLLEEMGAKIEIVKMPSLKYSEYAEFMTFMAESAAIHKQNLLNRPQDFGKEIKFSLQLANTASATDYLQAQQIRKLMAEDFAKVYRKADVLIAPTLPMVLPNIGEEMVKINGIENGLTDSSIRLTAPVDLVGLPSISVPCGFHDGMPVAFQIMGPAFKEQEILNMAFAYEKANPMNGRKPDLDRQLVK